MPRFRVDSREGASLYNANQYARELRESLKVERRTVDELKKLLRMIKSEDAVPELLEDMYDKIVGEG